MLGEGGFGITYLAFDENLQKQVAIKEYLPIDFAIRSEGNTVTPRTSSSKNDFDWGLKAFIKEARILAKFDHPNIVRINRYFQGNGTAYIVMDYVEGRTLSEVIKDLQKLTEEEILAILNPLIDGLKQVHQQNVYHRDIKPDNIILKHNGIAVLIDFGAARQAIGSKSRSFTALVTPGYAPIEQYQSKGKLGAWTDIYALSAVAYTCLTGKRPDDATDRVINDELIPAETIGKEQASQNCLTAIDQGLSIKPENRPQTLESWWQQLSIEGAKENPAEPEPTPPQAEPDLKASSKRKIIIVGSLLIVLMIMGVGIAQLIQENRAIKQQQEQTRLADLEKQRQQEIADKAEQLRLETLAKQQEQARLAELEKQNQARQRALANQVNISS